MRFLSILACLLRWKKEKDCIDEQEVGEMASYIDNVRDVMA